MRTYIAIVDGGADCAWGVRFPDVDGCYSGADDARDIFTNAMEALDLHLDGQELPGARTAAEIAALPEYRDELAQGSFLVEVPLLRHESLADDPGLASDPQLLEAVDAAAGARDLTRSAFLARAALDAILDANPVFEAREAPAAEQVAMASE